MRILFLSSVLLYTTCVFGTSDKNFIWSDALNPFSSCCKNAVADEHIVYESVEHLIHDWATKFKKKADSQESKIADAIREEIEKLIDDLLYDYRLYNDHVLNGIAWEKGTFNLLFYNKDKKGKTLSKSLPILHTFLLIDEFKTTIQIYSYGGYSGGPTPSLGNAQFIEEKAISTMKTLIGELVYRICKSPQVEVSEKYALLSILEVSDSKRREGFFRNFINSGHDHIEEIIRCSSKK